MSIKNRLEWIIQGWLPKDNNLSEAKIQKVKLKNEPSKQRSWFLLLLSGIILSIVSAIVGIYIFNVSLTQVIAGLALACLGMCAAYYIRVRPSMNVNRVIYIILGAGTAFWIVFGGSVFVIWATGLSPLTHYLGSLMTAFLIQIIPWIIGGVIGDWIGKRRNYLLPFNPLINTDD